MITSSYELIVTLYNSVSTVTPHAAIYVATVSKRASKPPLRLPNTWIAFDEDDTEKTAWRPTQFGRVQHPKWKPAITDRDKALLAAAQNQHELARGIRAYRDRLGLTTDAVATAVGMTPDHLRKILRGAAHVGFTDLHLIAAAVGSHLTASVRVNGSQSNPPNKP